MDYSKTIFIQTSDTLNGVLRLSMLDMTLRNSGFVDKFDSLKNRDKILEFEQWRLDNGLSLKFADSLAEDVWTRQKEAVQNPFEVRSPFLEEHKLFPFQHIGLNFVQNQMDAEIPRVLVQWDTGAGKTLLSCLTSQKLFDEGKIDKVLVFCKKIKTTDWEEEFKRMTYLSVARISEKWSRKYRHEFYEKDDSQVLILNYEKVRGPSMIKVKGKRAKEEDFSRTDIYNIINITKDKNILVIIDESQKINTGTSLLSDGFDRLLNREDAFVRCLALTATPYTTSPLNIRNIFSTIAPGIRDVSTLTRDQFKLFYGQEIAYFGPGYARQMYVKSWNQAKLPLLGKKHENWTHIAMKSDPEIAKQFPESMPKKVIYELSDVEKEIYIFAEELARERFNPDNPVSAWGYVDSLRMLCNTTEGFKKSESSFAQEIVDKFGSALDIENSSKYQLIEASLETIFEANEKVVLFTYWTNGTLFPYMEALKKKFKDVPVLPIWGVGMKAEDTSRNIKQFNATTGPAVLITSDVGQEGLNLYAPYLWNIEIPRTYAEYKQRKDRINRADSKSKGISHTWIYRPVALGTIEERIEAKVLRRRAEAEAIRGVVDENVDMLDTIDVTPKSLLFGI